MDFFSTFFSSKCCILSICLFLAKKIFLVGTRYLTHWLKFSKWTTITDAIGSACSSYSNNISSTNCDQILNSQLRKMIDCRVIFILQFFFTYAASNKKQIWIWNINSTFLFFKNCKKNKKKKMQKKKTRLNRGLNHRPLAHEPNMLTTYPPSHTERCNTNLKRNQIMYNIVSNILSMSTVCHYVEL